LEETEQERSPEAPEVPRSQRTEWNIRDSDGTLVILSANQEGASQSEDPGTRWAIECATRYQKPLLVCNVEDSDTADKIRQWLAEFRMETLSVGGPSETTSPGIGDRVYELLTHVFKDRTARE
jgi:hypothetical protein